MMEAITVKTFQEVWEMFPDSLKGFFIGFDYFWKNIEICHTGSGT